MVKDCGVGGRVVVVPIERVGEGGDVGRRVRRWPVLLGRGKTFCGGVLVGSVICEIW